MRGEATRAKVPVPIPTASDEREDIRDDVLRDKCGVFGIWGDPRAAELAFLASHMQQHRGQAGAGIVSTDANVFYQKHGSGLVGEVFRAEDLKRLKGVAAVAHVRYPTQGPANESNLQPFVGELAVGTIAIAHNGEFANHEQMTEKLKLEGTVFTRSSDTELALHTYARSNATSIEQRIADTFAELQPSYSIVGMTGKEMFGLRDPNGVRPLVLGRLNNRAFALASETVALDAIKAEYLGEVNPGELIVIDNSGMRRLQLFQQRERLPCIFEHIYFGRPDSVQFGAKYSNAEIRREFGRQLYREHKVTADLVCPVPDSSVDAALGFSEESIRLGNPMPLYFGLVRSHYIRRTFIEPTQLERDMKIRQKFNANSSVISGKRVVIIDDSIVRGSTIKQIVAMLREGGAKEVHIRISSPPYVHGCYLGIDTAERDALIGYKLGDTEKIRAFLKADSLGYLSQQGMLGNPLINKNGFCTFCFDGIGKIKRK